MSHPIERLRWIARAGDEPAAALGSEAAWTLGELADQEPNALLTASRRLIDRHPACGPLWWVSARLLASADPLDEGRRSSAELVSDSSPDRLGKALRRSFTAGDTLVVAEPFELSLQALASSSGYLVRLVGDPLALRIAIRHAGHDTGSRVTGWTSGEEVQALDGAAVLVVEALAASNAAVLVSEGAARAVEAAAGGGVPAWVVIGAGRALPSGLFEAAAARSVEISAGAVVALGSFSFAVGDAEAGDPRAVAGAARTCPPSTELARRPV